MDASARVVMDMVLGTDPRTRGMLDGWDLELARQKTLFFTDPGRFPSHLHEIICELDAGFRSASPEARKRSISYLLGIADSLNSPVELAHNLQCVRLHGSGLISPAELERAKGMCLDVLSRWEAAAATETRACLRDIKREDLAANKGDNLFAAWARRWESTSGRDAYGSVREFLDCFSRLYQPDMFYPALFMARERGETSTQFFNDYGLQAARCRKIGSLGGTTNPVIAVSGENDLDGAGNIWGPAATDCIKEVPNRWTGVRRLIAREQVARGLPDDWAATEFTRWVVVDAMLGLRSIFLLRGLGRVAFQLRPDWHDDEEKLVQAGAEIHAALQASVARFDELLLDGVGEPYRSVAAPRIGQPNNHFKIACTGQAALNVVRAFNAGFYPRRPGLLKDRLFTNVTLSYDVPQMVAASLATEEGIRDYEKRTGQKVDDGEGGSVVTSMIGRLNDAIRRYRVETLVSALPAQSPLRETIKPKDIKTLEDPAINNEQFLLLMKQAGIDFRPVEEEDAIDHAGTLLTKRAVLLLQSRYGLGRTRILTASKRKFHQDTDLLGVPFSTDFGNIQRMTIELADSGQLRVEKWDTLSEGMTPDGSPAPGSVWERRDAVLRRIWPDWARAYDVAGVSPDGYLRTIYVKPTLDQFLAFWEENVTRARKARESVAAEGDR